MKKIITIIAALGLAISAYAQNLNFADLKAAHETAWKAFCEENKTDHWEDSDWYAWCESQKSAIDALAGDYFGTDKCFAGTGITPCAEFTAEENDLYVFYRSAITRLYRDRIEELTLPNRISGVAFGSWEYWKAHPELFDAVKQGGGELDGYKIPLVLRFRMAEQLKDFAFIKSFTLDEVKVDSATIWTWWAHKRADILNMADKQAAYELCVNIEAAFLILDISGGMLEDVRNVQEACYTWAARAKN